MLLNFRLFINLKINNYKNDLTVSGPQSDILVTNLKIKLKKIGQQLNTSKTI